MTDTQLMLAILGGIVGAIALFFLIRHEIRVSRKYKRESEESDRLLKEAWSKAPPEEQLELLKLGASLFADNIPAAKKIHDYLDKKTKQLKKPPDDIDIGDIE